MTGNLTACILVASTWTRTHVNGVGAKLLKNQDAGAVPIVAGKVVVAEMKTLMKPIEMIAWFDMSGTPRPIRFRIDGNIVQRVDMVMTITEEKLAGNRMKIYRCQSEINGAVKPFELKYELQTCKWFLYKI